VRTYVMQVASSRVCFGSECQPEVGGEAVVDSVGADLAVIGQTKPGGRRQIDREAAGAARPSGLRAAPADSGTILYRLWNQILPDQLVVVSV
jgi:hypothetical protein